MLASEVIKLIQEKINEGGDLPFYVVDNYFPLELRYYTVSRLLIEENIRLTNCIDEVYIPKAIVIP